MNWSRIRDERKKKGYTLAQVAAETGYSVGYLSQLERNQKEPSLAALRKIANCLGCSEVWLIMGTEHETSLSPAPDEESTHSPGYILRRDSRVPMKLPEIDTMYSIFTPSRLPENARPRMTGLYVTLKPGCWATETMILHKNADESVLIMQGQLEVHIGTHVYNALEGDCLYIPKNTLHNYLNTGLEDAQCIVFFSDLIY